MSQMSLNGVEVTVQGIDDMTEQEAENYIDYIRQRVDEDLESLTISAEEDGNVALDYSLRPRKFERIRRITGYLVETIDR